LRILHNLRSIEVLLNLLSHGFQWGVSVRPYTFSGVNSFGETKVVLFEDLNLVLQVLDLLF
jgi:hypothetical protein